MLSPISFLLRLQIGEKSLESRDVSRALATDATFLSDDLLLLKDDLESVGIVNSAGCWVVHEVNDRKPGRVPGWTSRCRVIQCDEKGEFIHYEMTKGALKRIKYSVAKGMCAHMNVIENRESSTHVPCFNANGHFIFGQLISKGAGISEQHMCDAMTKAPIVLQFSETGQQTTELFIEAKRMVAARIKFLFGDDPLITGQGVELSTPPMATSPARVWTSLKPVTRLASSTRSGRAKPQPSRRFATRSSTASTTSSSSARRRWWRCTTLGAPTHTTNGR